MRRRLLPLLLLAACGRPAANCIGLLAPQSGPLAARGHEMRLALDLALAELPEDRRPQVLTADSQGSARHTTAAYAQLAAEGASVVLGPLTTDEVEAAALVARSERVPCIAPAATGADVGDADGWTVRTCYADEDVARALAGWARMTLHLERLATVVDLRSSYSIGLSRAFTREFSRLNGRIVGEVTYHGGDPDAAAVLDAVAALPAEGALLAGYAPDVLLMLQGANDPRLSGLVLLGGDGWGGGMLDHGFQGRVKGAYHTRHFDPNSDEPAVRDFVARWQAATGERPSDVAALTYDAASALLSVLPPTPDDALLRQRLLALHDRPGVTGTLTLDARGAAVRRPIYLEQLHEPSGPSIVARL